MVIAVLERATSHLGGDIGVEPEIQRLVPIARRHAAFAALGPPGDEIVVIPAYESAPTHLGGDVGIDA